MSRLKQYLPTWLKRSIKQSIRFKNRMLVPLFKNNGGLASIFYALFSRKFDREHKAVLSAKARYRERLYDIGKSSALLRRNIHRLEKGLIMRPRRPVFAEDYIGETVDAFDKGNRLGLLAEGEKKWARDVLQEYFNVVGNTTRIDEAKKRFEVIESKDSSSEKFIPYPYDSLPETDISYEELQKLFIKRRSVRWYEDKEVPKELIAKAADLASLAPSACNRQPYSFYVSDSKEKAVQMAKCAGGTPGWADNIPCLIAIIGDLSAYPEEQDRHLIYIDGSLAAMQLILALETLGLSSCSINWPDIEGSEKKMQSLLELKDYERPVMLLSVGYAENKGGIPYSQKKSSDLLVKYV